MIALRVEPLDGDDRLAADVRHRDAAGPHRFAVHVHSARAAQRDAAAELRTRQAQFIAQVPHQRHRRIAVERPLLPIHPEVDHEVLP
jgi:hypothetical protein